jgi:hypothetical protein
MAKKSLFALLSCSFTLFFYPISILYGASTIERETLANDECTAPPPDNFRATDISLNYISLAWQPAWPGANHTLSVQEKNISGTWIARRTFYEVSGSSFVVDSLDSGVLYKFVISTNCATGETSSLKSSIEEESKVIDLVIAGRNPTNPTILANCHTLNYIENDWVGFKIDYASEGILLHNIFEFKKNSHNGEPTKLGGIAAVTIKRVNYNSGIYAADLDNNFPTNQNPIYQTTNNRFKIGKNDNGGFETGGLIKVTLNSDNSTVEICPVEDQPWNNKYKFTPLVVTLDMNQGPNEGIFRDSKPDEEGTFSVQNPFSNSLEIFNFSNYSHDNVLFRIFNTSGYKIFEYRLESFGIHESIPIQSIPNGIYLLHIETAMGSQIQKLIKCE